MDEFSPRARRRSALLTWQHIASLPPSLPVVYCGGFNTEKESTTGRFLLGRSRYCMVHNCSVNLYCLCQVLCPYPIFKLDYCYLDIDCMSMLLLIETVYWV